MEPLLRLVFADSTGEGAGPTHVRASEGALNYTHILLKFFVLLPVLSHILLSLIVVLLHLCGLHSKPPSIY